MRSVCQFLGHINFSDFSTSTFIKGAMRRICFVMKPFKFLTMHVIFWA